MIEVKVTKNIHEEAEQRNLEFFERFGNSGTHRGDKNRQRMTGYLAEACIKSEFPEMKYSEDFNIDFNFQSMSIDSKAQGCNSKPLGHYSATLYEEQRDRHTDYYIFNRVKNDFNNVWICGIISKEKFFKLSKLKKAGTRTNNFTYDQSRYELEYKHLASLQRFVDYYKSKTK